MKQLKVLYLSVLFTMAGANLCGQHVIYYSTASWGGAIGVGAIIGFDPASGSESLVFSFSNTAAQGFKPFGEPVFDTANHLFYGITHDDANSYIAGTIYSFNPLNDSVEFVWDFVDTVNCDPETPLMYCPLTNSIIGMATDNNEQFAGVIFVFNPQTGQGHIAWNFAAEDSLDGKEPFGTLVYDNLNGLCYGTTMSGGRYGYGTIITFNPLNDSEQVIYNFNDTNGRLPAGELVYDTQQGLFYGTTAIGGTDNVGVIYSFNPDSNTIHVCHNFSSANDGRNAGGANGLTYCPFNGYYYCMTYSGGRFGTGSIISLNPVNDTESLVYSFRDTIDGSRPTGKLIYDPGNNMLYGLTFTGGGSYNDGAIIGFNPATNTETVLYNFGANDTDGIWPYFASFVPYVMPVTGIKQQDVEDFFLTYPNPANNVLFGTLNTASPNTTLQITSTDGRIITQATPIQQNHFELDISTLAAGIYFITLQNENDRVVRRFVKE